MDILSMILITFGLILFETISSVDNAIINAQVLSTMGQKMRISNIDRIQKYIYLKNGAMYSILILGLIMLLDSFGLHIPSFLSPITTAVIVGYFFLKSKAMLPKP